MVVQAGVVAAVAELLVLGDAETKVGGLADVEMCRFVGGGGGGGRGGSGEGRGGDYVEVDATRLPGEVACYVLYSVVA